MLSNYKNLLSYNNHSNILLYGNNPYEFYIDNCDMDITFVKVNYKNISYSQYKYIYVFNLSLNYKTDILIKIIKEISKTNNYYSDDIKSLDSANFFNIL